MTDAKHGDDDGTLPLIPDQYVGNYQLLRLIGTGAMGEVYLARHRRFTDRQYAVKLIRQGAISEQARVRFEREIEAMGKVVHSNLVYAIDAGMDGDRMYLVMEYVEGQDLQREIDQYGLFRVPVAAEIIRQICIGVSHAHQRGVVHRDIKPANVMLSDDMTVKVMDLGIASLQSDAAARMTVDKSVMGTASFIAPELWLSATNASPRSDVYAIGCTAYCLLTGQPPFAGEKYQSLTQVAMAHEKIQPTPLAQLRKDVPKELNRILQRTLHKNPAKRFQAAAELAEQLAPFCGTLPKELPQLFGTSDHVDLPPRPSTPKPDTPSPIRKLTWIAGLLVAVIAVVAWWLRPGTVTVVAEERIWMPPKCSAAPAATLVTVKSIGINERLCSEIELVPEQLAVTEPIRFVLVPQCGTNSPGSFYIMKDKVSAALFEAFEKAHPESVDRAAQQLREENKSAAKSAPAYFVTGEEAIQFAAALGGKLPTPRQWEAAFGWRFDEQDFDLCISASPSYTRWVRTNPVSRDPALDQSRWGCLNMGSQGLEFTRFDADWGDAVPPALAAGSQKMRLELRGRPPTSTQEIFRIDEWNEPDNPPAKFYFGTRQIDLPAADISFRIVLEKDDQWSLVETDQIATATERQLDRPDESVSVSSDR